LGGEELPASGSGAQERGGAEVGEMGLGDGEAILAEEFEAEELDLFEAERDIAEVVIPADGSGLGLHGEAGVSGFEGGGGGAGGELFDDLAEGLRGAFGEELLDGLVGEQFWRFVFGGVCS